MILWHGSDKIINHPEFGYGKKNNDYGRGFYCTEDIEAAKEWACKHDFDGYANQYSLDMTDLSVLDLREYNILNWMAILLKNRTFRLDSSVAESARDFIIENYLIDVLQYDIVVGYRADDSYFQYAQAFVSNGLSVRHLKKAMELGKLGVQTAVISEKAFSQLNYMGSERVPSKIYHALYQKRDTKARKDYTDRIRSAIDYKKDIFVVDIMRGAVNPDDTRI